MKTSMMISRLLVLCYVILKSVDSTNTPFPTIEPLMLPQNYPSSYPTAIPFNQPTKQPRKSPSLQPLSKPTEQPTNQPDKKPIFHPSGQPKSGPSRQPLWFPTCQPSKQPRRAPSHEPSLQPTQQPRIRPKTSPTTQPTRQPVARPNRRPSRQPTCHPSAQPRRLPSIQPHAVPTFNPSMPSSDPTRLPTSQPFHMPTSKPSLQPKRRPSSQPYKHPTGHPTSQPVFNPTSQPSQQPSRIPTRQPIKFPTVQPSEQPLRIPTGQPLKNPSGGPSGQPLRTPTCQPTLQPQTVPSLQPKMIPSDQPSNRPNRAPTFQPQPKPTKHPFILPSSSPTCSPSLQPTTLPSHQPLDKPTMKPTEQPTTRPSHKPSRAPSKQPMMIPSGEPSHLPSIQPSSNPSIQPAIRPTTQPTCRPIVLPSLQPSCQPTKQPSGSPIRPPTSRPSQQPQQLPSKNPSEQPSSIPSDQPSTQPRHLPTKQPSRVPTSQPTNQPNTFPSVVPSRQPLSQPSSEPSRPSAQPSSQPSTQPVRVPTFQPTTQPTSYPSLLATCAKGSYYNLTGHSYPGIPTVTGYFICIQCSPGKYSDQIHLPRCKICPKGTFSPQNSTGCTKCAKNTYAENNGTSVCTQCNAGEFNGLIGSFSASDCVNPSINFILGGLACFASMCAIAVYIWRGRLHRIAFQRRFRLIRKCIIMYGAVLTTSDMITQTGIILDALKNRETNMTIWRKIYQKIFKPIFYFLLCLILLPMVIALSLMHSVTRIVFNAMVLWRAYNGIYIANVNFIVDCLRPFLFEIGKIIHSQEIVLVISYPLINVIGFISNLSINLSDIKVTCIGAQSPLYLLCDVLIVGVVIIIIESDVNVFWTMLSPTVSKIRSMVFSRHYIRRNCLPSITYLVAAILISQLPDPSKLVQYSMGFVVITKFFNLSGNDANMAWVNVSPNCDATVTIGKTTLPIDSLLAYPTGILVVIAIPPVVYMVSVVLFARTKAKGNESSSPSAQPVNVTPSSSPPHSHSQLNSSSESLSLTQSLASFTLFGASRHSNIPSTPNPQLEQTQRQSSSLSLSSTPDYPRRPITGLDTGERQTDLSDIIFTLDPDDEDAEANSVREEKRSTNGDEPQTEWASPAAREGIYSLHASREERSTFKSKLSKGLRIFSSFFAVDWFFLKFIFTLGRSVFSRQRDFLVNKFMIHTSYREYDEKNERYDPNVSRSAVKVYVDAFDYDNGLTIRRKYATKAKIRELPLLDGLVAEDNADAIKERTAEDDEWKKVKGTLPDFLEMSMEVKKEMKEIKWLDKWLPWSYTYLCYLFPAHFLTKKGRESWKRVIETYIGMVLVCCGIWPKWVVKDFDIIERFKKFVALQEDMYRSIGDEIFHETQSQDVFTKIDNNGKVAFGQFVASMCTCRIALLQIAPVLTPLSLFSSSVAGSPLIVLCPEMAKELPPLLDLYQPFIDAKTMLKADYINRDPPRLLIWFLGYYILINQSRLIQFFINGYSFMMSVAIIFFPKTLFVLTPFLTCIVPHQAILSSIYTMLVLKKLMFGQKARAEGGDVSSENEGRADMPLEESIIDDEASVAAADNDMSASNNHSYIDDEENTIRSPSRAKGSLWLQSSSSDSSFILHSTSDSGLNISSSSSNMADNNEASLTPARKVKKLSI